MKNTALIALGSNLNDPLGQLKKAVQGLQTLGKTTARSSLYQTAPVGGPPGQAAYLNAVVSLQPHEAYREPEALLEALLSFRKTPRPRTPRALGAAHARSGLVGLRERKRPQPHPYAAPPAHVGTGVRARAPVRSPAGVPPSGHGRNGWRGAGPLGQDGRTQVGKGLVGTLRVPNSFSF